MVVKPEMALVATVVVELEAAEVVLPVLKAVTGIKNGANREIRTETTNNNKIRQYEKCLCRLRKAIFLNFIPLFLSYLMPLPCLSLALSS